MQRTNLEGLEILAGYAENLAAIKDTLRERDASTLDQAEPETATNIDLGLRYAADELSLPATWSDIGLDHRITFIPPDSPAGIDLLIVTNGSFLNVGGIEASGIGLAASYQLTPNDRLFGSFTRNDATYIGSGSAELDAQNGITPGNTVFGSVEDQGVLSLDWRKYSYRAGLSAEDVGERWVDLANTGRIDSFVVTDFYAGVNGSEIAEWLRGHDLHLTVSNLWDGRNIGGVAGGSGGWIGGARTALLTVPPDF